MTKFSVNGVSDLMCILLIYREIRVFFISILDVDENRTALHKTLVKYKKGMQCAVSYIKLLIV